MNHRRQHHADRRSHQRCRIRILQLVHQCPLPSLTPHQQRQFLAQVKAPLYPHRPLTLQPPLCHRWRVLSLNRIPARSKAERRHKRNHRLPSTRPPLLPPRHLPLNRIRFQRLPRRSPPLMTKSRSPVPLPPCPFLNVATVVRPPSQTRHRSLTSSLRPLRSSVPPL